ncbi:hypothetical protein QYE76_058166 [Lolium multiflorum]|uniref:CCHC-type domain-containing protein n=1 Tax=Lolium multiflorum TaxID=4521 RepID=A0AAD8T557_LOLMU|nr:hypothetical protein QYE76_058166 [Lolium multiflorum]
MCLTQRLCSGDEAGDWDVAAPLRRRRCKSRAHGGRLDVAVCCSPTGSRFSPLADALRSPPSPARAVSSDLECDDEDAVAASPAAVCLGSFFDPAWTVSGATVPSPPHPAPALRGAAPPPPLLGEQDFPPLPSRGLPLLEPQPASQIPAHRGSASFRVGDLAIPLPVPRRPPVCSSTAPPPAATSRDPDAPPGEETLAGLPGPRGPGGPVGPLGLGLSHAVGRRGTTEFGSAPSDDLHVASPPIQQRSADGLSVISNHAPPPRVFKWWWLPPGTLDLSLAFPAPPSDVRRNLARAKTLTLANDSDRPLPVLSAMDRNSSYGKRSYEESQGGYYRSRDQDLRQKLDREQEEQRRQQRSRDREGDRAGSSSWRHGDDRYPQERLPPPPPPGPRGRDPARVQNKRSLRQHRQPQGSGPPVPRLDASASGVAGPANPDAAHITCYNCGNQGHIQADCTEEPFCVNCKKSGHLSAMCAAFSRALAPFWAGFGGGRQGFMCCEVPQEELHQPTANSATVIIEQGSLTAEEVEEEFKDLVDETWDWQVRQISASDFAVVFPSKESLRIAIRGGGLTLPSSKLKAIITMQVGDPLASETLVETWIRLIGVPPPLRHADRLLLCTRELGRPIGVDMDSLAHPSAPIRMSVGCQAPVQLQDYITLFVNMQGYRIRIEREDLAAAESPPHAPPPAPARGGDDDKDEDNEETDEDRWDGYRGRHRKNDKEVSSAPAGGAGGPGRKSCARATLASTVQVTAPSSNVQLPASVFSQYGTNLTETGDIFPMMAKIMHGAAERPLPQTAAEP